MSDEVEIIKIEQKLPVLTGDFEAEKLALTAELDKYKNVLVTQETLKDDKKLAGSLSAKGKRYNSERIRIVGEVSKPIVAFTDQMKELSCLCSDAAKLINDQVKVFEEEKLKKLRDDLLAFLENTRQSSGIEHEFRRSELDPKLIKLGSLTAKGSITKSAKDAVIAIVNQEYAIQQRTHYRLLQLESESHKAGLLSPLDRISVETFLFAEDEAYQQQLTKIIDIELGRQKAAEAKIKAKAEQEAKAKIEAEAKAAQEEAERLAATQPTIDTPDHDPDPVIQSADTAEIPPVPQYIIEQEQASQQPQKEVPQVKLGNMAVVATAQFELSVPNYVTAEQISAKLRSMIESAGITSCTNISIAKV